MIIAGNGNTVSNTGAIIGGQSYDPNDILHAGIGIVVNGNNNRIINSASITGGRVTVPVGFVAGNKAVAVAGAGNELELHAGYDVEGPVRSTGANNSIILGGSVDALFQPLQVTGYETNYDGFARYRKTGTSTWTVKYKAIDSGAWSIEAGRLILQDISDFSSADSITIDAAMDVSGISAGDTTFKRLMGATGGQRYGAKISTFQTRRREMISAA